MKKLLLAISLSFVFGYVFTSCRNSQHTNSTSTNKLIADTVTKQSNLNITSDDAVAMPVGEVDNSTSSNKDTLAKPKKATAIIHSSPEQQKIDSIKNSKPKDRK